MQHGFEQAAAIGFGGKLGFQLVAQRHQFINFGDDAMLFGEGGRGKANEASPLPVKCLMPTPVK